MNKLFLGNHSARQIIDEIVRAAISKVTNGDLIEETVDSPEGLDDMIFGEVTYSIDGVEYKRQVDCYGNCLDVQDITPSKEGFEFVGWREDTIASNDVLYSKSKDRPFIKLYAVFKKDISIAIESGFDSSKQISTYNLTKIVNGNNSEGNILTIDISNLNTQADTYSKIGLTDDPDGFMPQYIMQPLSGCIVTANDNMHLYSIYSITIDLTIAKAKGIINNDYTKPNFGDELNISMAVKINSSGKKEELTVDSLHASADDKIIGYSNTRTPYAGTIHDDPYTLIKNGHNSVYSIMIRDGELIGTQSELDVWEYEVNSNNRTVILKRCHPAILSDVIIYSAYELNDGRIYQTILSSNDSSKMFKDDSKVFNTNIRSISFAGRDIAIDGNDQEYSAFTMNGMFWPNGNTDNPSVIESIQFPVPLYYHGDSLYAAFAATTASLINISGLRTSDVTNMGYMFWHATNLTSILGLDSIDTSKVLDMNNMFAVVPASSIDVSNFDTGNVTNMSYMFDTCPNITSVDMSAWNTSKVSNISYMFRKCNSLISLDLRMFDFDQITNYTGFMSEVQSLEILRFPKITVHITDTNYHTNVYEQLETISNFASTNPNITVLDISECKFELNSSYRRKFKVSWGNSMPNSTIRSNATHLYLPPSGGNSNVSYRQACYMWRNLQTVSFPKAMVFTTDDLHEIFDSCEKLTQIEFSSIQFNGVTDAAYVFNKCYSITSEEINGFIHGMVSNTTTVCSGMFGYCSSLTQVDVSSWDTSKVKKMDYMFAFCASLVSLDLTSFDLSSAINMEGMFKNCANLTEIKVSRSKWIIPGGCDTTDMFTGCGTDHVTYVD